MLACDIFAKELSRIFWLMQWLEVFSFLRILLFFFQRSIEIIHLIEVTKNISRRLKDVSVRYIRKRAIKNFLVDAVIGGFSFLRTSFFYALKGNILSWVTWDISWRLKDVSMRLKSQKSYQDFLVDAVIGGFSYLRTSFFSSKEVMK